MRTIAERGNSYRFLESDDGEIFLTVLVGGIASELITIPLDDVETKFIRENPERADDFARQVAQNDNVYRTRAIQPVIWD
jgi:hypothetical protein